MSGSWEKGLARQQPWRQAEAEKAESLLLLCGQLFIHSFYQCGSTLIGSCLGSKTLASSLSPTGEHPYPWAWGKEKPCPIWSQPTGLSSSLLPRVPAARGCCSLLIAHTCSYTVPGLNACPHFSACELLVVP